MEHADRFLRRFYIEKGMFGSLSLTFIFYRPPLEGDGGEVVGLVPIAKKVIQRFIYLKLYLLSSGAPIGGWRHSELLS